MEHTRLTVRGFSSLSLVVLLIGLVSVGFGTVDLLMIAPLGVDHVAAVGQGDLIVAGVSAFFGGAVDVFSSRFAIAEGEGARGRRLPVLLSALLLLLVVCQVLGLVVVLGIGPLLEVTGQQRNLIPLVSDYVSVRGYSVALVILYAVVNEALKICGMKNKTFVILVFGFAVNAGLDWLFLYTPCSSVFSSPESAVSVATVGVQVLMACCGIGMFVRAMRSQGEHFVTPARAEVVAEFRTMASTASGVGARHLNDWAGAIIPMIFIGTLGVQALAAVGVATKIYTLFCRVPQSCVSASFVFYGYAVGRGDHDLPRTERKLLFYAAVPTAVATVLVVVFAPWLVCAFSGGGMDESLAWAVLIAFLLPIPVYLVQATFGEMLTVHQRGGFLSASSTIATYLLTVPLAWYAVFVLRSPFLAIAFNAIPITVLALLFWGALRRQHQLHSEVRIA